MGCRVFVTVLPNVPMEGWRFSLHLTAGTKLEEFCTALVPLELCLNSHDHLIVCGVHVRSNTLQPPCLTDSVCLSLCLSLSVFMWFPSFSEGNSPLKLHSLPFQKGHVDQTAVKGTTDVSTKLHNVRRM